jgi:hypothetical protein
MKTETLWNLLSVGNPWVRWGRRLQNTIHHRLIIITRCYILFHKCDSFLYCPVYYVFRFTRIFRIFLVLLKQNSRIFRCPLVYFIAWSMRWGGVGYPFGEQCVLWISILDYWVCYSLSALRWYEICGKVVWGIWNLKTLNLKPKL